MLSQKIDQLLIDLAWSLWTELGVAGIKRNHHQYLIPPEELVILTSVLGQTDPRLRDEALDWCTRHHHFISVSRLRTLSNDLGSIVNEPLSLFSATLNSISQAHWPVLIDIEPLKFTPSQKSRPPQMELPALLALRLRSLFGVGARADLISFFLIQEKNDFAISDTTKIGYSKRNLAEVLEGFAQGGILSAFSVRNQWRYQIIKRNQILNLIGQLPEFLPDWRHILEVVLSLRATIRQIEKKSESTKLVEIRNLLSNLETSLRKLNLTPPPLQADFEAYWNAFAEWILRFLESLARGSSI